MRIGIIIFALFVIIASNTSAEWVGVEKKGKNGEKVMALKPQEPEINIIESNSKGIELELSVSGFDMNVATGRFAGYKEISLLEDSYIPAGNVVPEVPVISKIIAVPAGAKVEAKIISGEEPRIFSGYNIKPRMASHAEGEELPEISAKEYDFDGIYPNEAVRISKPMKFRDINVVRVDIAPIQYNMNMEQISVIPYMKVKIDFITSDDTPIATDPRPISPAFEKIYKNMVLNYEDFLDSERHDKHSYDVMLCIMPDEFKEVFESYAEWRHRSGTYIITKTFSEIGANSSNYEKIRDYISEAYHTWAIPPTYVLMVGDYGVFPVKYVTYPDYTLMNEDYFVCVDGDDHFADMMVGRIPIQSEYRLEVILNKLKLYETQPYMANTNWFKHGIVSSNNLYASQVDTKRFTRNVMLEDGGFTEVDTLWSDGKSNGGWGGSGCTVKLSHIISALSQGRSFLNYRGEGWSYGWQTICFGFETEDISQVNNGLMMPFISSIGCGVAKFDEYSGNCFGEEWLKLGTKTKPRGSIAFVGPTSNTHTSYNNRIDKGIYVGLFREGLETPAQALLRGKIYMFNVFGDDPWVKYHSNTFCLLGDPGLHLWKDVPRELSVSYEQNVPKGYSQLEVDVNYKDNNQPAANAVVCISADGIYSVSRTDENGRAWIDIHSETPGSLNLTVRGESMIPFLSTVEVINADHNVHPLEEYELADVSGNGDNYPNPTETCSISFVLKNEGNVNENNVKVKLELDTEDYAGMKTTDEINIGTLNSGAQSSPVSFEYILKDSCKVGYELPFRLSVISDYETRLFHYDVEVRGCDLSFMEKWYDETKPLYKNNRLESGETSKFIIQLENIGTETAKNVSGVLTLVEPDEFVTILKSNASWGSIDKGSNADCTDDAFVLKVREDCPEDHEVYFNLHVQNNDGRYNYSKEIVLYTEINDEHISYPTGPDNYGYYAYTSDDLIFKNRPVYSWKEIKNLGQRQTLNYQAKEIDLPFTFKYYGREYNSFKVDMGGWIAFGNVSGYSYGFENEKLPSKDQADGMVAAMWIWTAYSGNSGSVYTYYDEENHRFIIEYYNINRRISQNSNTVNETFQILLYDPDYVDTPTGDGEIVFNYKEIYGVGHATIGVESPDENDGLQLFHNGNYNRTVSWLEPEFAIKVTTQPPIPATVGVNDNLLAKGNFELMQNIPNPVNNSTMISYFLEEAGNVEIEITDMFGRNIRTLVSGSVPAGMNKVVWDGLNNNGSQLASGTYIYSLKYNGSIVGVRKMIYQK